MSVYKIPSCFGSYILQVQVSREVRDWSSANTTSANGKAAGSVEKEGRLKEERAKRVKKAEEAKVSKEAELKTSFID